MKLMTKRLVLRKPSLKDAKDLAKNGNEKSMFYFTWYIPYPFTIPKAKKIIKWLNKKSRKKSLETIAFCIVPKDENKAVGIVDIYDIDKRDKKAKIGYWIGKRYRGKGFTSEAVKGVLNLAFDKLKLNKVSADTLIDNYSSNALLGKLGFRRIGIKKKDKVINGKALDCFAWEIIK